MQIQENELLHFAVNDPRNQSISSKFNLSFDNKTRIREFTISASKYPPITHLLPLNADLPWSTRKLSKVSMSPEKNAHAEFIK